MVKFDLHDEQDADQSTDPNPPKNRHPPIEAGFAGLIHHDKKVVIAFTKCTDGLVPISHSFGIFFLQPLVSVMK